MINTVLTFLSHHTLASILTVCGLLALVGAFVWQIKYGSGHHSRHRIDELGLLNPPSCAKKDSRGIPTGRTCCGQTADESLTLSRAKAGETCDCDCHGKPGA